jgi:mRNA degradation ribonuclease J1/J2
VHETLEDIIKTVKGRLIIGTFASQFERMVKIIEIARSTARRSSWKAAPSRRTSRSRRRSASQAR